MHKWKSWFDGGLQVWKPLLCLDKETLTICQTPLRDSLGWGQGGHSMTACGFCNALVSERAAWTGAGANVERTNGMCHCFPLSYLFSLKLGHTDSQSFTHTQTPSSSSMWHRQASAANVIPQPNSQHWELFTRNWLQNFMNWNIGQFTNVTFESIVQCSAIQNFACTTTR